VSYQQRLRAGGALALIALCLSAVAAVAPAGARSSVAPCTATGLGTKAMLAKEAKVLGANVSATNDSGHPNDCIVLSSVTGRQAEVYIWPKSQAASAVGGLLGGTFAGQKVKKVALGGLGAGAVSYNGVATFTAGKYFVALFGLNMKPAQTLAFARLVRAKLA